MAASGESGSDGSGGGVMSSTAIARNIPVAKPFIGVEEEVEVLQALRSGWVSQGPRVAEFERQFAAYVGAAEAVAVSSCTTALHLALMAAGVQPGDEVLCPSLSFIATANSIVYAGACPVFVDVDPTTFNIDPGRIEELITERTRAILLVHQIGMPAAIDEIAEIARRRGLALVEDAACAIGSEYKGARIGAPHTQLACFSFHPRKILTTGEGGMITTADAALAARLRRLRQHAMGVSDLARHSASKVIVETYDEVGYNYRMTDLQAAVGLVQLRRLDEMVAKRRALAARYTQRLSPLNWMITPSEPAGCVSNFQSYMVRLTEHAPVERDDLMQRMLDRGISTRRGIMATHREAPYRPGQWDARLPVTNLVTDSAMILPLYHQMTDDDQDYVIETLLEVSAN
jgi:dTDP-4-amino-4,6-dideoxygalactose transaminase